MENEKLKKMLNKLSGETVPDDVHGIAEEKTKQFTAALLNEPKAALWRVIMKSRIARFAAAAAVLVCAVGLFIGLFHYGTAPVWAIEQTIDVLKKFNAIHIVGMKLDEQKKEVSFEAWGRANKEQTAADSFRLKTETGQIGVVSKNRRYEYDPQTQIVKITEGYGPAMSPWPGGQLLETLKKSTLDWHETYGKDPATNRERVFVTCSHPAAPDPRSWWFEVDLESKLLISFKQWDNMTQQGPPSYYVKSITYLDDLPDELFHFETPEGAKTVMQTPAVMWKMEDPNAGMPVGEMTEEQASKEAARRYWQAVIDQDWDTVAQLRPIATAEAWKMKYSRNFKEIVEIGQPYQEKGCKLGQIVPCTIRCENNSPSKINMVVMFREINGQRSCVIAGTWGSESE